MNNEKSISSLYQKRNRLRNKLSDYGYILKGTVVVLKRPCTYRNCRKCKSGLKHAAPYLSYNVQGRTKLIYLCTEAKEMASQWTKNYREFQELVEKLSEVNRQILQMKGKLRKASRRE